MGLLAKFFSGRDPIKSIQPVIDEINKLEEKFKSFSRDDFVSQTQKWKDRLLKISDKDELAAGLDSILPEAMASVREAAKRTLGQRHFDVQLAGGIILHQGKIAEMKTGEGKTLASTLPAYLNALAGRGVHLVTVNDYLARRDASWMGQIYHYLGLSVGSIQHEQAFLYTETDQKDEEITKEESDGVVTDVKNLVPCRRREAYAADITYGTNNEFGFDYLRDNMAPDKSQLVQRELFYSIVDEVDSILIDEARTPLIISAPDAESGRQYQEFSPILKGFTDSDYVVDEKLKQVNFTEQGYEKLEAKFGNEIYSDIRLRHHAEAALRAKALFKIDRDYVVKNGEIIIVDEFTGRLMPGRRYSEGLHQAIEAKEGVPVQNESKTLATITFQNYFRLYQKLSGMTGTAATEAEEFGKIYNLEVAEIPTNKPQVRADLQDSIYKTEAGKFEAIVREAAFRQKKGQPVLIGTVSIEKNEELSSLLKKAGVAHEMLNAKNHEREARIVAQAGRPGAVTLATNIAGRGVDIILGGNPYDEETAARVKSAGGLHVLGTERHESRRIDNQLRGRSGRQGDPGSSQFFLSLEDDLMRLFGGDRLKNLMTTLRVPDDQPIENRLVSKSIESAQSKIEGMNFDTRKHVLEFDDVLNKQRGAIYTRRRKILEGDISLRDKIIDDISVEIIEIISTAEAEEKLSDLPELKKRITSLLPLADVREGKEKTPEMWINELTKSAEDIYSQREARITPEVMRQIERVVTLRAIDNFWMEHLDTMDHLRRSVRLRGYAQKDPLIEYQKDGRRLFEEMLAAIDKTVAYTIFRVDVKPAASQARGEGNISSTFRAQNQNPTPGKKIGRNDPCPCGAVNQKTGKPYKYKHCGLINAPHHKA